MCGTSEVRQLDEFEVEELSIICIRRTREFRILLRKSYRMVRVMREDTMLVWFTIVFPQPTLLAE